MCSDAKYAILVIVGNSWIDGWHSAGVCEVRVCFVWRCGGRKKIRKQQERGEVIEANPLQIPLCTPTVDSTKYTPRGVLNFELGSAHGGY
jgi:hypothetical protein